MTLALSNRRTTLRAALLATLCTVASAWPAAAQSSLQVPLQFDFINPGAKNIALGGAFVGLADDATATFANPAGLTQLGASEVSIEVRTTRTETPFLQSGRVSGAITGFGSDTVPGPVFGSLVGVRTGIGFGAGVFVAPSHRWVLAGFRHELVRVKQHYETDGVFLRLPDELTSRRENAQIGDRELTITGYGVAGAYKLRPALSLGLGLTVYRFAIDSLFRRFLVSGFGPPVFSPEFGRGLQTGRDTNMAGTVGITLGEDAADRRRLVRRIRLGAVYRHGGSFGYDSTSFDAFTGLARVSAQRFRVPHTLAGGASLRLRPQWLLSAEVTRIGYARLRQDFVTDQARGAEQVDAFAIDNGTEVHVGTQFALPRFRVVPRLRAGAWFDPDHSVRYAPSRPSQTREGRVTDDIMGAALSKGSHQVHLTGGVGLTLHRRAELNLGLDVSASQFRWSSSLIVR